MKRRQGVRWTVRGWGRRSEVIWCKSRRQDVRMRDCGRSLVEMRRSCRALPDVRARAKWHGLLVTARAGRGWAGRGPTRQMGNNGQDSAVEANGSRRADMERRMATATPPRFRP